MTTLGIPRATTRALLLLLSLVLAATMPGLVGAAEAAPRKPARSAAAASNDGPLVIGHRGASGYRPEHTLASYRVAIRQGADYIEPDLVPTRDGVLVARHENEISTTTDVSRRPRYADRRTTKTIDGIQVTGWFTEDFTLAELKRLRAVERLPDVRPNNTRYDGRFEVPTFDEVLALVNRTNAKRKGSANDIGVYPETKHPTYFQSIGLALERRLLRDLRGAGLERRNAKVFVQSFETGNLQWLNQRTDLPIIQLMDSAAAAPYDLVAEGDPRTYADLATRRGQREISRYADGIGPNKSLVIPVGPDGFLAEETRLVEHAHRFGLDVHIFTLRRENQFMAKDFQQGTNPNSPGNMAAEVRAFLDAGVDGFFTDNPDIGVAARRQWERSTGNRAA